MGGVESGFGEVTCLTLQDGCSGNGKVGGVGKRRREREGFGVAGRGKAGEDLRLNAFVKAMAVSSAATAFSIPHLRPWIRPFWEQAVCCSLVL